MKNPEDETKLDTLQRQLTSANRAWFSRLRLFMWLQGWARDRSAVASQLLAMMQDLLDAQRDGACAESFFGQEPKAMAKAILRELPLLPVLTWLRIGGSLIWFSWFAALLLAAGRQPGLPIRGLTMGLLLVLTVVGGYAIIKLLAALPYATARQEKWLWRGGGMVMLLWLIGTVWLLVRQPGSALIIPAPLDLAVIALTFGLSFVIGWRLNRLFRLGTTAIPIMLMLLLWAGAAVVQQYLADNGQALSLTLAWWVVGIGVPLLLLYFGFSAWSIYQSNRLTKHLSRKAKH